MDLEKDREGSKDLLYVVVRNKMKPKTEWSSVWDKNIKLAWAEDVYLQMGGIIEGFY
jgi:hypothetical protein